MSSLGATRNFLFLGGPPPPCAKEADADISGDIDINDEVYVLNFLFLGGNPPLAPYPDCGVDPTFDLLTCGGIAEAYMR